MYQNDMFMSRGGVKFLCHLNREVRLATLKQLGWRGAG